MNGSSDDILAGVSPVQIRVLLDVLSDSAWPSLAFVEDRYQERARNFAETLTFLRRLEWVRIDGAQIHAANGWIDRVAECATADASVVLLDALLDSRGSHQQLFASYLRQFQSLDGVVSCPGGGEIALTHTSARDFLMELGAVRHEPASKRYFLQPPFFAAYVWALAQRGPENIEEFIDSIENRHWLGLTAELAIVEFERKRLGSRWADRVQHVAADHPGSPYDIRSVTVIDERPTPRYIEVKAVSPSEPMFHWSAIEVDAARLLRSNYYLYLVPTNGPTNFDLARLQIIADPFTEVYSQPSAWDKLSTNFLCRPVKPLIS
jgi:uncharacterized protein DUF3883